MSSMYSSSIKHDEAEDEEPNQLDLNQKKEQFCNLH